MARSTDSHGCRLVYEVRGEGPPVLFIQGTGVHGGGWGPQVDGLADRYRCLWFDNRGMGRSLPAGLEKDGLSVARMADDARAILDAEGWDSAHVIGHSLGGQVAVQLALTHRRRVRSLGLLCTFAAGGDVAPLTPRMLWLGTRTRIGTRPMRRRAFLQLVLPPRAFAEADLVALAARLTPLFGHDLAEQPEIVGPQLAALRACDLTPRLGELAGLPTLVVSAAHDPIAPPPLGQVLAAGIPGARYVELADASHGVPMHQPEVINRLLLEHLSEAEPG